MFDGDGHRVVLIGIVQITAGGDRRDGRRVEDGTSGAAAQGGAGAGRGLPARRGRVLDQALVELEVAQHLDAERHERTPARTGQNKGVSGAAVGSQGGHDRAAGAAGAGRQLFPQVCWSRASGRGGRSGAGAGHAGPLHEPGESAVPGAGRRGGALSDAAPGGLGRGVERGRGVLAGVPARAGGPRSSWSSATLRRG